jgi:hypothetical protein
MNLLVGLKRFGARKPGRQAAFPQAKQFAQLGDRERDARNWAAAAAHYAEALGHRREWPEIWVQYGHALKEGGDLAAAERAYATAREMRPDDADVHLQLGHALKLQKRTVEAGQAYLEALHLAPSLGGARDELANLGWTKSKINGWLRRRAEQPRAVSASAPVAPLGGEVDSVGTTEIGGRLQGLSQEALPLTVVCRRRGVVMARHEVEAVADDGTAEFRLVLPSEIVHTEIAPLHLQLEPIGVELRNSPVMLPSLSTAEFYSRVERLEYEVDRLSRMVDDNIGRVSEAISFDTFARVSSMLEHQRAIFERQLLNAGLQPAADAAPSGRLSATQMFPGWGWYAAEEGVGGKAIQWMGRSARLLVDLQEECDHLVALQVEEAMSPAIAGGLRVSANGVELDCWTERAGDGPAIVNCLVRRVFVSAGRVALDIHSPEVVWGGSAEPRYLSVAVSEIVVRPCLAEDVEHADPPVQITPKAGASD